METIQLLELIYGKNYFNHAKMYNWCKWECSRINQRFVMKFMIGEECKPCEMYKRSLKFQEDWDSIQDEANPRKLIMENTMK